MNTCRRIFSGIQPTGVPHIGNYYGAIKNWIKLQSKTDQVIFSIVDMHALTVPKDPEGLKITIEQTAISLLASGIDPEKCILFQQSQVMIVNFNFVQAPLFLYLFPPPSSSGSF